jgi:hypothetical protein
MNSSKVRFWNVVGAEWRRWPAPPYVGGEVVAVGVVAAGVAVLRADTVVAERAPGHRETTRLREDRSGG